MNKIYRRLWSTARQCWVVASELSAPRGKASQAVAATLLAVSALAASPSALAAAQEGEDEAAFDNTQLAWALQAAFGARIISASSAVPSAVGALSKVHTQLALTTDDNYRDATVSGNHLVVLGSRSTLSGNQSVAYGSYITSQGDNNTAIGFGVQITGGGYATGVGSGAVAHGIGTTAIGNRAIAQTENSIAVGSGSATAAGAGVSRIAIGGDAYAGSSGYTGAIALGGASRAEYDGVAVGHAAKVTASKAQALGRNATATAEGAMALGADARATGNSGIALGRDAQALGRQSFALGQSARADGWASLAMGAGARSRAEGGLAFGYEAQISNADAKKSVALGEKANASHANAVALGAGSVTTGVNQISVGTSSSRRKIVNVADGTVSASSADAVTGRQLFATDQKLDAAGRALATGNVIDANKRASASGNLALAVGQSANANGVAALAVGHMAVARGGNAIAIGSASDATAEFAVALGGNAEAAHRNSVALGEKSVTTGAQQVSVGNATMKRKIVNVADGTVGAGSSDAVTGSQLHATETRVTTNRNAATAAQASANQALSDTRLLNGLLGQTAVGGSVRLGAENTGTVLDVSNKANVNRKVSGVADGALTTASTDAVNGKQLLDTNNSVTTAQNTATIAQNTATSARTTAESAVAKADVLGGLVGQVAANGNIRLGAENTGGLIDVANKNGGNRRISNVAEGTVSNGSADAVTGHQLYTTNNIVRVQGETLAAYGVQLSHHDGRIAGNLDELQKLRAEFEDFDPDLDGVVKFDAGGNIDVGGGRVTGIAAGDISSAGSADAVNGGQLFSTNQRVSELERESRLAAFGAEAGAEDAESGNFGVAIGNGAQAALKTDGGTAIGSFSSALGENSVAVGRGALVEEAATLGFALGTAAKVQGAQGVALGTYARVENAATGSVALGAYSEASERDVVSVGNQTNKRKIVNMARGGRADDGATVGQISDTLSLLGGGAVVNSSGDVIAPTYNIQGGTQNTVGDALSALDSAVVAADSRVDNLEGKLRSTFHDGPSVRADGLNQLALAGTHGSVLTNLADGRIAAGSRDAVTGSQLFEAKEEIARNRNDLNDLRGERDGLLSRGLMAAEQGSVIDYGGARLTGVADGVISAESRDVVNGRQLFEFDGRLMGIESERRFFKIGTDEYSENAYAGLIGVAIGESAEASRSGEGGVAVGGFARAQGTNSVALGRGSRVIQAATNGFALGASSRVDAEGGLAVGANSRVLAGAKGSIALGEGSIADVSGTISVGGDGIQRRMVNVANGRNANDATTVGQLRSALATLGGDIDANGNIISPNFNVQGGQQSTLNEALSTIDAAVVTNTTRTNRVESQLNAVFQDSPTVRNDGLNQLTFAGANGMVLSNVANGAIAAGSRDAVNGGQLHSMQQQLNGRMDGLENRIDSQPQSRAMTVASADAGRPAADDAPPSTGGNPPLADAGNAPKSAPQPQAGAPKPESPTPQVDTAELEKMLARANEYSDGISREVDRRLDKMDKRFNRMAAMTSAQSAMAMNTAGLNTYNRLGAGVGYSEGESAMAVGYQRVLNDKGSATFSLNGAFTNSGERSMGVGVGIGW